MIWTLIFENKYMELYNLKMHYCLFGHLGAAEQQMFVSI